MAVLQIEHSVQDFNGGKKAENIRMFKPIYRGTE